MGISLKDFIAELREMEAEFGGNIEVLVLDREAGDGSDTPIISSSVDNGVRTVRII